MCKLLCKIVSLVVLTSFFVACGHGTKDGNSAIMVYSGAGLTDALTELRDSFELKTGQKVNLNLASSGTLARQIESGGESDIYISASVRWADYIDSLGYILKDSRAVVAVNDLALIAPVNSNLDSLLMDSSLDVMAVLEGRYFAIGNPAHVPAGKYAKQTLEFYDKYKVLDDQLLLGKDVRSVLMMVELEEAQLGLVYATDAYRSKKVKLLSYVANESHTPIAYVGGLTSDKPVAQKFLTYITSEESRVVWDKYGFKN